MLFVVNVLVFNGGTTFVLRMCKAFNEKGIRPGVFILFSQVDEKLLEKIKKHADVYFLKDYLYFPFNFFAKSQISTYLPMNFKKISKVFDQYNNNIHVMGVFGLLFIDRYRRAISKKLFLTLGIYHQNEFMFNSREYYFIKIMKKIFELTPEQAVLFFNEHCVENYSKFFSRSFSQSLLLPVGIERPSQKDASLRNKNMAKIISVGNLYKFKTYNKHIIDLLPLLKEKKNDLEYHIYGEGENETFLKDLAKKKGVEESVFFHGVVDYEKLQDVLASAFLFVGSGTALIEAAISGIPSIVGIESIETPETYGFIFETTGYTYHELDSRKKMHTIEEKINEIINNEEEWFKYGAKCKIRAEDFLIDKTLKGFLEVLDSDKVKKHDGNFNYSSFRMLCSIFYCGINSLLKVDRCFVDRRNQGTIERKGNI